MIRNLKALGLALCAAFAFGAFSASSALALNDLITSGSASATTFLTGTQIGGVSATNVFGTKWVPNATVTCKKGTYTGSYAGTTAFSVEVTPQYGECATTGGIGTTVDEDVCMFVLTGTTDTYFNTSGDDKGDDATVKLNCIHTGQIRITGPFGCIITFKDTSGANTVNQTLLGVKYDNESDGTKWDVKMTVTVDGIHYTSSGCGFLGITATDNDGFLTTNVTFRAYEDVEHKKQVNLTVT